MGGIGKVVGGVTGALTGGLIGGGMEAEEEGTQQMTNYGLVQGDLVALLPINGGQNYIVLGKLIYAADFASDSSTSTGSSTVDTLATAASVIGGL